MSFRKIISWEPMVEKGFYTIVKALVFMVLFSVVYLLFGWKVTAVVVTGELLFFVWNLYEMKHSSGG